MTHTEATVFIIDDDADVRESTSWLIESMGMQVKTYSNAKDFLDTYNPNTPGCLVLDIRMPEMSGLQLQDQLNERRIRIPIIFITGHGDIPMAKRALKSGAIDFLTKPFNHQELLDIIHRAIEQDLKLRTQMTESNEIGTRIRQLTPRETQILDGVVAGKANKVIANDLDISPKTVELHRASMMRKMQAKSLADLVRMVLEHRNAAVAA